MGKEIKLVIVDSEIGAGTRGASLGIGAMKVVAHNNNSDFFGRFPVKNVSTENDLLNFPNQTEFAKHINGVKKVYDNTANALKSVLAENHFPLVLAGDHSTAGATIAGIKMAHPNKRLGVVWIDAHGDLHTPYTTPSGNMHGMPLAVCLNEDNTPSQINNPSEEVAQLWNEMKNLGGIAPKINAEDLVFISVRDTEKPEDDLMARHNIKNYEVKEVREKGTDAVFKEIQDKLNDCDLIYVSFDVDSMDCDIVSRGTGTPVENGLTPDEARFFLNNFAQLDKVCCMEVVEVNPCLDNKINKMAEVAFELTNEFTQHLEKRIK